MGNDSVQTPVSASAADVHPSAFRGAFERRTALLNTSEVQEYLRLTPPSDPDDLPATLLQSERRPGWKTTEFWYVVATDLGIIFAAFDGAVPAKYAALALALSKVAYSIARGLAKQGSSF